MPVQVQSYIDMSDLLEVLQEQQMVKGLGRGNALQMPLHDCLPCDLTRPEYALHSSVLQSLQGNTAHTGGTVNTVPISVTVTTV